MSCKKGDFVTIRHNDLRVLSDNIVCKDREIEPKQTSLSGEDIQTRTSNC